MMKVCKLCGEFKELSEYYNQKNYADRLDPFCKCCRNQKSKEYAAKNKDRLKEYRKDYYKKNEERERKSHQEYYLKHRERLLERMRIRREKLKNNNQSCN